MSENDKQFATAPMEFPSQSKKSVTEPIVDVVENELFPPKNCQVQNIISKAPQEQQSIHEQSK